MRAIPSFCSFILALFCVLLCPRRVRRMQRHLFVTFCYHCYVSFLFSSLMSFPSRAHEFGIQHGASSYRWGTRCQKYKFCRWPTSFSIYIYSLVFDSKLEFRCKLCGIVIFVIFAIFIGLVSLVSSILLPFSSFFQVVCIQRSIFRGSSYYQ